MQFENFKPLALVTEARIEKVMVNRYALLAALSLSIASSEIMDIIKKNVYYNRPFDQNLLDKRISEAISMANAFNDADIATAPKEVISVDPRIFHAIIGKHTEVGEMLEALEEHVATGEPLDLVNLREEIGDDQWYNAILCDAADIDMGLTLGIVIDKLRERYGDKFTAHAANNRDLVAERHILEGGSKKVSETQVMGLV